MIMKIRDDNVRSEMAVTESKPQQGLGDVQQVELLVEIKETLQDMRVCGRTVVCMFLSSVLALVYLYSDCWLIQTVLVSMDKKLGDNVGPKTDE